MKPSGQSEEQLLSKLCQHELTRSVTGWSRNCTIFHFLSLKRSLNTILLFSVYSRCQKGPVRHRVCWGAH